MFVKKGKGKGYQGKDYQRYQCKACGTTFSSRSLNWTGEFRKPELVRPIFNLYTSGCSIRRLAIDLKTTKNTVVRTIKLLSEKCQAYHREYVANGFIDTDLVFFDEMESFEHSKALPVSIGIAVDFHSKKIIDARVAEIKCKGRLKNKIDKKMDVLPSKYFTRSNRSKSMRNRVMEEVKKCIHPDGEIITDDKRAYITLIRNKLPGVLHTHVASRMSPKYHPNPVALGRFNSTCASIRTYMSRMGRRTLITSKKKEMLQAHLYMFIARHNGYDIDEILKQEWFEGRTFERVIQKKAS